MSNTELKKDEVKRAWSGERIYSSLETTESNLSDTRKDVIRFALSHPIHDIRTYAGYKGDLIVQITANKLAILDLIKAFAKSLDMQTVVKEKHEISIHELYCISPDPTIYELKEPV